MCDFTGQLAGAGATRWMASFGAEIIRIEDPTNEGRWDILRGSPPFKDERRGAEFGSGFNNHNVEKLGITLNLRTERGKELLRELVPLCDAVTDNFAAGVLDRLGFGYGDLCQLRDDIIYVSNSGFGATGPYAGYKSWGPIAQAVSGLTHESGLPGEAPAGWGYSYMDHTGGYYMAIAILMALFHRQQTGQGQWVDLSCTEAGATLHGAGLLDWSVNGRSRRGPGLPNSIRSSSPVMAPHGVFKCRGDDNWVAIACRDHSDWEALRSVLDVDVPELAQERFASLDGRIQHQDDLDARLAEWCESRVRFDIARDLQAVGVPASAVLRPAERIDGDAATQAWGLWPAVEHPAMGGVRVDGQPVHFSKTDWSIEHGGPTLGQHNGYVLGELLGLSDPEIDQLHQDGVI
ncbi:MAG: CoA transferase [Actinomycetia bacterium]|nr:CoA transferase [Actinomycetes bacterium]MCP4083627.1 CoA transferase [Actinomycetes bacterium]